MPIPSDDTPTKTTRGALSADNVPQATTKPRARTTQAPPPQAPAPSAAPPAAPAEVAAGPAGVRQMSIRLSSELFEEWNGRMEALDLPRTPAAIAALRALLALTDDELVQKVAFESFQRDRERARRSA